MQQETYFLWLFAAFIVGASKGGLSSIGAISVPILAFRMDILEAAALLLPVYILSDVIGMFLFRRTFSRRNLAILVPAGIVGVVLATWLAPRVPADLLVIVTGAIGVAYCWRAWFGAGRDGPARAADVPRGIFWGILAGITSFVSHTGAPPYQTYVLPQRLPKMMFAGTTTILFAVINFAKLPAYWSIHLLDNFDLNFMLPVFGATIVGSAVGYAITRVLSEKHYTLFIQIALAILSLRLVAVGVWSIIVPA